jgi:hypothetical protein
MDLDSYIFNIIIISSYVIIFSGSYVNWFCSYLTNRQSQVRISGTVSSLFQAPSGVRHGTVLGPLHFKVYINDLCGKIKHSRYLPFADDLKNIPSH